MSDPAPHLSVVEDLPSRPGPLDLIRRRLDGTYSLDPWGFDEDVSRIAGRLSALRWRVTVEGLENLPGDGPALLVANRRLGWSEPAVVVSAVFRETGAIVRAAGGLQIDPVGGVLRRLGAIPARAAEVGAALRAGNLVLVPTRREPLRNQAGHLPVELLAPAVEAGVPLVPVAVIGWEFQRRWTVRIGAPVHTARKRSDRRSDARHVGTAAVGVAATLDDLLADAHEFDLLHRILARLPEKAQAPAAQWEVD